MPFKVKNLMVSVLPQSVDTVIPQIPRTYVSPVPFCPPTTLPHVIPTGCTDAASGVIVSPVFTTGTRSFACQLVQVDPGDLVSLNALKGLLDAHIEALNAQLAPQTVEEADMLEGHLTEALNEVKATKETLRKAKK